MTINLKDIKRLFKGAA